MASRTLTSIRHRNSMDQDRETFEKNQSTAIMKAVNELEVPVKAKHVRSAIIGTFQEKGSHTFWSIVIRLPIQGNPILAWKFCHTLHKLLREGHANVLKDSQRYRDYLMDSGKLWGHLKEGYGKLIFLYCRLLAVKLDFHKRNPQFPGNLMIKDEELEHICQHDINNYFQLTVELLDYMDEILSLQAAVFGSLDMSRSNSMTNAGQCRLAPLIPCIQDSSQLYDFIVKLLFRLHNRLPADTLVGHRDRFFKQFKHLKQFYVQSSSLQYFKSLIQVPQLEENPPNFLISSELSRHVTPVVILPPEPVQTEEGVLISLESDEPESERSGSPDLLAERDRYIEHLLHEIEQLMSEINKLRHEKQTDASQFRQAISGLEAKLAEMQSQMQQAVQSKEEIERKLSEAAKSAQLGAVVQLQLAETEKRAKLWEDKFIKMKDVYQKLRDEHIALLRQKADIDKKLTVTIAALEQSHKSMDNLKESLETSAVQVKESSSQLEAAEQQYTLQVAQLTGQIEELNLQKTSVQDDRLKLKEQLEEAHGKVSQLLEDKTGLLEEKQQLSDRLSCTSCELQQSQEKRSQLEADLLQSEHRTQAAIDECATLRADHQVQLQLFNTQQEELKTQNQQLLENMGKVEREIADTAVLLEQVRADKQQVDGQMKELVVDHQTSLADQKSVMLTLFQKLLLDCAAQAELYLSERVKGLSKAPVAALNINEDQELINIKEALHLLECLNNYSNDYRNQCDSDTVCRLIPAIFPFAQSVSNLLLLGQQLAHSVNDIDQADKVLEKCTAGGKSSAALCHLLQQSALGEAELRGATDQVENCLRELDGVASAISEQLKAEAEKTNVGQDLENELAQMERAIEDAAARMAELWDRSKESHTGVKLQVNEKVLDSCAALMKAIIELIKKAKTLQEEIVARGKGSAKDFYKKNHRWTEGLLSAAKAVGFGAKLLTDAADRVVEGQAKFEQLTVASQEIAASTAQLVFASRVKAEAGSANLQALSEASKCVSSATGKVVATAKQCAQLVEESSVLDFAHLTLHQAKRYEMESQVKVLELESSLDKERLRLAALRRQHYQLAGQGEEST